MALETATYISGLVPSNPVGSTDDLSTADDHLRLIKSTVVTTFPNITGAVTATHTELNYLDGATGTTGTGNTVRSASPTFTGTLTAATVAAGALTATSYGGITEANLLDKSATETITANWTIDPDTTGPFLTLGDGTSADGDSLLRLNIDRAWAFKQSSSGSTTALGLQSEVDSKQFSIMGPAGNTHFYFQIGDASNPNFRIFDSGGTDYAQFSHDGTDFNTTLGNTTDWNITGITAIQAGTVDADFDAITATSYGGITEANLLDKSAAETVSGAYTFSASPVFSDEIHAQTSSSPGTPAYSFSADTDCGMYRSTTNTIGWSTAGVNRMTLNATALTVTGDVSGNSDVILKDDLEVIPDALQKVEQISGYTFTRNDSDDTRRRAGVIAQEIEKVLPEVVTEGDNGLKSVAYGNLTALLIEAVKELNAKVARLEGK